MVDNKREPLRKVGGNGPGTVSSFHEVRGPESFICLVGGELNSKTGQKPLQGRGPVSEWALEGRLDARRIKKKMDRHNAEKAD